MKTKVTPENYFDAAQALYWYCNDWHSGQSSELYSIMSARLEYNPGCLERGPEEGSEASTLYAELESGAWDATEMLDAIKAAPRD